MPTYCSPPRRCSSPGTPPKKSETFTVQPKFEGNALDFGMVIPTPTAAQAARDAARLLQAPRHLHDHAQARIRGLQTAAAYRSARTPTRELRMMPASAPQMGGFAARDDKKAERPPEIKIPKSARFGSLDYKIIEAGRADDLFKWLKDKQIQLLRRRGDPRTLRPEEMALHRHEDRHHADENATRTVPSPAK